MNSIEMVNGYDSKYEPYIREILSLEVQCRHSCQFIGDERGMMQFKNMPSVFHWSRCVEWPFILHNGDFQPHHKVLDIGSSWGCLKYAIASRVAEVVANDHDGEALRKSKETSDYLQINNITYSVSDLSKLPFPDNHFDRVVNVSVLEHIAGFHHVEALKELVRVIKPGGKLLMSLDVRVEGYDTGEFCVDIRKFKQMVEYLGIPYPSGMTGIKAAIDAVKIVVPILVWNKPGEGKKVCNVCHKASDDVFWSDDPYTAEINPDKENPESWWCRECYQLASDEI